MDSPLIAKVGRMVSSSMVSVVLGLEILPAASRNQTLAFLIPFPELLSRVWLTLSEYAVFWVTEFQPDELKPGEEGVVVLSVELSK